MNGYSKFTQTQIKYYTKEKCLEAYSLYKAGMGENRIAKQLILSYRQAEAAISAGLEIHNQLRKAG